MPCASYVAGFSIAWTGVSVGDVGGADGSGVVGFGAARLLFALAVLIADGSGVVFIPQRVTAEVIEKAEALNARERLMANAIRSGQPVSIVMGATYEVMLKSGPQ